MTSKLQFRLITPNKYISAPTPPAHNDQINRFRIKSINCMLKIDEAWWKGEETNKFESKSNGNPFQMIYREISLGFGYRMCLIWCYRQLPNLVGGNVSKMDTSELNDVSLLYESIYMNFFSNRFSTQWQSANDIRTECDTHTAFMSEGFEQMTKTRESNDKKKHVAHSSKRVKWKTHSNTHIEKVFGAVLFYSLCVCFFWRIVWVCSCTTHMKWIRIHKWRCMFNNYKSTWLRVRKIDEKKPHTHPNKTLQQQQSSSGRQETCVTYAVKCNEKDVTEWQVVCVCVCAVQCMPAVCDGSQTNKQTAMMDSQKFAN